MLKMPKSFSSKIIAFFIGVFVFVSDQISKYLITHNLYIGESLNVCDFFNIVYVKNKGVTFGMLNNTLSQSALIILSLLIVLLFLIFIIKYKHYNYMLSVGLIIGGALGNIVDRVVHGAVIDFLDIHVCNYHWPAFNIADSAICIGITVCLMLSFVEDRMKNLRKD